MNFSLHFNVFFAFLDHVIVVLYSSNQVQQSDTSTYKRYSVRIKHLTTMTRYIINCKLLWLVIFILDDLLRDIWSLFNLYCQSRSGTIDYSLCLVRIVFIFVYHIYVCTRKTVCICRYLIK